MAVLQITVSEETRVIEIPNGLVTLGRHSENDIVLEDAKASRRHCTLQPYSGAYILCDLDSRNGTKVNGKRIDKVVIQFGEAFEIGKTCLRIFKDSDIPVEPLDESSDTNNEGTQTDMEVPVAEVFNEDDLPMQVPSEKNVLLSNARRDLNLLRTSGDDPGFSMKKITFLNCHGQEVHKGENTTDSSEAVRTLRLLFYGAFRTRATDIHFDPVRSNYQIRFRVDGKMLPIVTLPGAIARAVISVVKVLSELDITGKQNIQDGSFSINITRHVDCRVSLTPTIHGEKLVMRVLDTATVPVKLDQLGLSKIMYKQIQSVCRLDSGMMIVSGPTGSGKTTTLYTALRSIDSRTRNVITIEDPIEYHLDGVTQIQTDKKQNLDFSDILRSVLRQDPDVILVGEIRDRDTAQTAMQAAMTGHLVFSTLHARDSIGSMFRLLDLGVEAYMIANSVSMCLAQRLVRVLCPYCKKPYRPKPSQLVTMGMENRNISRLYTYVGCRKCMEVGYWGRAALFELLNFNDNLRDALMTTQTIHDIRRAAGEFTYQTLLESGYRKVAEGTTTIEEVERVAARE